MGYKLHHHAKVHSSANPFVHQPYILYTYTLRRARTLRPRFISISSPPSSSCWCLAPYPWLNGIDSPRSVLPVPTYPGSSSWLTFGWSEHVVCLYEREDVPPENELWLEARPLPSLSLTLFGGCLFGFRFMVSCIARCVLIVWGLGWALGGHGTYFICQCHITTIVVALCVLLMSSGKRNIIM